MEHFPAMQGFSKLKCHQLLDIAAKLLRHRMFISQNEQ